jgi:hypothetical protein
MNILNTNHVQKAVDKLEKVVKYLTNITVALNGRLNITNNSNITKF